MQTFLLCVKMLRNTASVLRRRNVCWLETGEVVWLTCLNDSWTQTRQAHRTKCFATVRVFPSTSVITYAQLCDQDQFTCRWTVYCADSHLFFWIILKCHCIVNVSPCFKFHEKLLLNFECFHIRIYLPTYFC